MPDYSLYSIDYSIFSVEITRFNAYNKDTFNDILVVQGSIITVTKLANNKSLLSQLLNRTTRIYNKK